MPPHDVQPPTTAVNMLKRVPDLHEGDVIICNDPYLGGQHLLDVQFFSPVFVDGEVVAFVADIAHQLDMGGSVPGGVAGGLTEIYQEGLRIPFVKLSGGERRRSDLRLDCRQHPHPRKDHGGLQGSGGHHRS